MARNYTGLVKAVNTTNRRREAATSLSDDELIDMMAEVAASMPASSEEIMATRTDASYEWAHPAAATAVCGNPPRAPSGRLFHHRNSARRGSSHFLQQFYCHRLKSCGYILGLTYHPRRGI